MNQDISYSDFEGFDNTGNYNRPKWIGVHRTGGAIDTAITQFLIKDRNSAMLTSAVLSGNSLKYWKDIFSKNMESLNGPNNLITWQKKYALVLQQFLKLLSLKARYLSKKALKKELKKLKEEILVIQAKQLSEEQRIKELNNMLEAERQKALQQVQTIENTPKPKEAYKPIPKARLTKLILRELLGKLGLQLGANSQNIETAFQALQEEKQRHPGKYSEHEWAEIEEAHEILSAMDDSELDIIAQSKEKLTENEAELLVKTLKLDPNEPHTVDEVEKAFLTRAIDHSLNANEDEADDTFTRRLYQTFVNQTGQLRPTEVIDFRQLIQEQQQQAQAPVASM